MKYDSYSRFLKSQMYKDSIVYEMESKPLNQLINIFTTTTTSSSLMPQQPTNNNSNSIMNVINSNVNNLTSNNVTNENRKDKKRSTILPWTKGMEIFFKF